MTVSILIATTGRIGLERSMASVTSQTKPGDQVLVIGATPDIQARATAAGCQFYQCRPGNDWGASERAAAMPAVTGDYVAYLDDDDIYLPGALDAMHQAMASHQGKATIFKMHIAWTGGHLWTEPVLKMGNIGTPMMFLPTPIAKRGTWGRKYGNDFVYLNSLGLQPATINWSPAVIASIRPK